MPDALIIRLHSASTTEAVRADWLLVDAAGARMGIVLSGTVADAASLAMSHRVIVLLPAPDVLLAQPTLPLKRGTHLDHVVRYALEDQFASDVDDLHFAVGKRGRDGATPVAAVADSTLARCMGQLAAAGIVPDAVYSEADALPLAGSGTVMLLDGGALFVRHGEAPAVVLDVEPLSEALQLAVAAHDATDATDMTLYATQADYDAQAESLTALRERVPTLQIKILQEGPLPLLAPRAVTDGALINLLAGKYQRKKNWNSAFAPWRIVAGLAGVVLITHIAVGGVRFWQLTRDEKQLDKQLHDVVAQTLPQAGSSDSREARRQFEQQLGAARAGTGSGGMLTALDALADVMEQVPDTRIDFVGYHTNVVDLRVTAPSVDTLARMQQLVGEHGMQADIQSATPRDNKVEGRLQLKLPGA